jgi:NAD(P)-dependent dehydrogenase (short-subunit alcohol dehydrogenase family)
MPDVPWAFDRAMQAMASAGAKVAEPDEVAAAISWLASSEASNVNGAIMTVDNGWASA